MSVDDSEFSSSELIDEEDPRWKDDRAYCICRGRDNGEFMINCEGCEEWYHGRCVGIAESQGPHIDNYYCPNCAAAGKGHTTYKGLGKRGTETRGDVETSAPKRQKLSLDEKKKFDMHRRREDSERRRAERTERARQKEDIRKREREENAAKFAQDAEAKAREAELKKKKDEEDLKLRREKMRANIASTIEEAFGKDQESKSIDKDLLENLKPIPQLANDIEVALFEASNNAVDKAYLNQYRTLVYNLRDVKNSHLRFRILKGLLKPSVLVTMDSEQLANKDIAQYRQKRDQELLIQTMKPKDTDRLYVKTDIGLELVPNPDGDDADLDYVDSALDSLLDANKPKPTEQPSPTAEGEFVDNKSESVLSASAPGSPSRESGGGNRSQERSEEQNSTPVKTPMKTEPRSNPATPLTSSFGPPPLASSFDGLKKKSAAVDLDDIGDLGDEGIEEPELEEGDAMELESDSKPDHNSFGVSTPENSDDGLSNPFAERLPSSLPTWAGTVKYQFQGLDLALPLSGFHVEGPEIGENLPRVLKVEHRMDLKQLLDYLPKLDSSSSRARTTMYFTVADSDESSYENYARLYQHLKEINRAGVFQIHKGDPIGVSSSFFKELYILPLGATDPKPKFIDDSRNYDRDLQNTLIGVFLTERQKPSSSSQRASIPVPAAVPQPQEAPAAVTTAQTQAKLDGIASLIAALGKPPQAPAPAPVPVAAAPASMPGLVPGFDFASLLGGANPLASFLSASAQPGLLPGGANPLASLFASAVKPPPPPSAPTDAYDPMSASQVRDAPPPSQYQPPPQYPPQHYPPQGSAYPPHRQDDRDRRDYQDQGRGYDNRGGHGYDNRGGYNQRGGYDDRARYDDRRGGYDDRDRGYNERGYRGRGRGSWQ